jgi:transposase-like protein
MARALTGMRRRCYSIKQKLDIVSEWETGSSGCKAIARKYELHPGQLRRWKKSREYVMAKAASIKDHTYIHHFLSKKIIHQGQRPLTLTNELDRINKLYDELRQRDRCVTLTLLAHNLIQNNVSLQDLSVSSIRRLLCQHLVKLGVVKRRVTRVSQNTRYDLTVKQQYVQYINDKIKIGRYLTQDTVSIDETNFYFYQASGETLANRGDKMIGCAVTGSANRWTVLLACTMSGEKLPPYIVFKGKDTRGSRVWKEFSTEAKRAEHGYPEESLYAVQDKAWTYQTHFLDWNTRVWTPFTQRPAASGYGSYMIMDEFKVHLMVTCLNAIQNNGTEVDFVIGSYTGCVQILDKGVNHPFQSYAREEFENFVLTNLSSCHPTRGEVSSWVNTAWKKITE